MKRYLILTGGLLGTFLLTFLAAEALGIPLLNDPLPWLRSGGITSAIVGVSLLVADVFLPVPSSLVMIAHGAIFGVFIGTLLSLTGSVGATLLGFAVGRRGGALLERMVTQQERMFVNRLLTRWGALAIVITRPIPLLAEVAAIIAGTSPLGWRKVTMAAIAGSLPGALLYALTGAMASKFGSAVTVFVVVLLVAAIFYAISHWVESRLTRSLMKKTLSYH